MEGNIAVKTMTCSQLEPLWIREAELLGLQHPNLLSMLDVMADEEKKKKFIHLALPLAKQSLLKAVVEDKIQELSLVQLLALIHEIICGVHALHQLNILHGDLKPANILITHWPSPKVIKHYQNLSLQIQV